jgi:iron-sulfur cluster repair protein YtfE (RIC family)
MAATDPLRAEHAALLPRIEHLRTLADSIDGRSLTELIPDVELAYDLVAHHITPHAMAEDRVLYPAVERVMGAPGATATMTRDHVEIAHLLTQLDAIRDALGEGGPLLAGRRRELRRILYGLHTLVKLHLAKEEEIYAPLLDAHLSEDEARRLFEDMHRVAGEMEHSISHFEHENVA